MTAQPPDTSLDAIRREIDSIDDQILGLLQQRFAAAVRVRASKASDGSIASSPFRPAREGALLRRLLAKGGGSVSPDVLVRLWRVILSASTQLQAPVTLHMDLGLRHDLASQILVAQHFCGMRTAMHDTPALALKALRTAKGDLAILATGSDWAEDFSNGSARVVGTLPLLSSGGEPALLVFGHAEPQESGDDETLILSTGEAPSPPEALWQTVAGRFTLTSVPGFLTGDDPQRSEHVSRLPGAFIAGRCPRPIKVST